MSSSRKRVWPMRKGKPTKIRKRDVDEEKHKQDVEKLKKRSQAVFGEKVGFEKGYHTRSGRKVTRPERYSPAEISPDDLEDAIQVVDEIEKNPEYSQSDSEGAGSDQPLTPTTTTKIKKELEGFVVKDVPDGEEDPEYVDYEDEAEEEDEEEEVEEEKEEDLKKEVDDLLSKEIDLTAEKTAEEKDEELRQELFKQNEVVVPDGLIEDSKEEVQREGEESTLSVEEKDPFVIEQHDEPEEGNEKPGEVTEVEDTFIPPPSELERYITIPPVSPPPANPPQLERQDALISPGGPPVNESHENSP